MAHCSGGVRSGRIAAALIRTECCVRYILIVMLMALAACGGSSRSGSQAAAQSGAPLPKSVIPGPQDPPVELGRRPPNTPMTSGNMPFFDTVAYCERATRKHDTMRKGPLYEQCVEDQAHYRLIIGQGIDAHQFKDNAVTHCAEASRTAYQGAWFCMNGQEF